MIVRPLATEWLVVAQADHARLAAEMLALLRLPELVDHPRRAALLRAVAEHDNGWWEEDAAPRLDAASGGPLDFRRLPEAPRRELWRRAVERHAAADPYVAALVAGHALRLHATLAGAEWEALRAGLATRRDELLAAAGASAGEAAADDRWLARADALALAAATGEAGLLAGFGGDGALAASADEVEIRLAPFDWAGATRFALPARRLPRRPKRGYASAVELGLALVTAPRAPVSVRLAPL